MRHGKAHRKLNRTAEHRKAMFGNMCAALIKHEQITTTLPKAKELRPVVEKLVTLGKRGDLHARRQAIAQIRDVGMVKKLFDVLGPRYKDRKGGYTRILKAGFRHGDNAAVGVIEFVDRDEAAKGLEFRPGAGAQGRRRRHRRGVTVDAGVTNGKGGFGRLFLCCCASRGPLHAQQANETEREMIAAAERGELVVVKKLLAGGARIDARDQRGRSALLAATQRNRVEVARFLIQEGADVNAKDFIQDTPYLYAGGGGPHRNPQADARRRRRPQGHQPLSRHRPHSGGASRPCRGGEASARDRDRQGSRQQSGWTALLEAVILGDGGAVAHRDRPAAGRGRRQREHRRPRRRDAARPCQEVRLFRHGPHPGRRRRALTDRQRCGGQSRAADWRCHTAAIGSPPIQFQAGRAFDDPFDVGICCGCRP